MRPYRWLSVAAVTVTAAALTLVAASPATAAAANLYVDNTGHCSDTGHGTKALPFCTVAAAAKAARSGQTVHVTGSYKERLTVARSGVTFDGVVTDDGPQTKLTGVTISGVHGVSVSGFAITTTASTASLLIEHSSTVTVSNLNIDASASTAPATDLVSVSHSKLKKISAAATPAGAAVILDKNTSYVTVQGYQFLSAFSTPHTGIAIDVAGDHDSLNGVDANGASSGIVVEKSADHTTIANSSVTSSYGDGVVVAGSHTAISNNIFAGNCSDGVDVEATATGTSVENSVVGGNGRSLNKADVSCSGLPNHSPVNLGVFGAATSSTTADYNTMATQSSTTPLYYWNGVQATLPAFQAASGQGAHDIVVKILSDDEGNPDYDSANSAAPGFPATDVQGLHREDDPSSPNTGAGPITYADRGIYELTQGATLHGQVTVDPSTKTVTVHAVVDQPGWSPISKYIFDFGDGSPVLTQSSPDATHTYAKRASYNIALGEVAADGNTFNHLTEQTVELGTVYHPVTPVRVLNTGKIVARAATSIQVDQLPNVPADAAAVLLDITVHKGSTYGSAAAFQTDGDDDDEGAPAGLLGTLHWKKGQTVSNLVSVNIDDHDQGIGVENNSTGTVEFLVDVVGYETYSDGSYYHASAPVNVLHTASPVPARSSVALSTAGLGLPATGVTALVMDVTASGQTAAGALTAYPGGTSRPAVSNVHWTFHQPTTNLVVVPVVNGTIEFYNASDGHTSVSADLVGYYATTGSQWSFTPDSITRVVDTRSKVGVTTSTPVPANGEITVPVSKISTLNPSTVVLNVSVTDATRSGTITVWGDGTRPATTNISFQAGQTVSDRVVVPVVDGQIHFVNHSSGTVAILADFNQYLTS
jgi:hypothetical protein